MKSIDARALRRWLGAFFIIVAITGAAALPDVPQRIVVIVGLIFAVLTSAMLLAIALIPAWWNYDSNTKSN